MPEDTEPLLRRREEPIFPIANRRAPILERIRERRNKASSVGVAAGAKVAELALFSSIENREEEAREIRNDFRSTLANKLGVPEEAINQNLVNEFGAMFAALDESDIVNEEALEPVPDESSEDEEPEEDSSDESSDEFEF